MAAILRRQPLTIKQQVEELKNWHKQQQSKLNPISDIDNSSNKKYEHVKYQNGPDTQYRNSEPNNSTLNCNFDEIPIKVTNSNFNSLVENNVAPTETNKVVNTGNKPKFRFLKRGEGIARFKMGPTKIAKKIIPRKQGLKLIKDTTKSNGQFEAEERKKDSVPSSTTNLGKVEEVPTLHVPDMKLNFKSWKNILSSGNPEDVLEKAVSNNQLELLEPNSSIDSSTASLMEKLLAIGKNKLSRDREELNVFEAIEQHILDSSFCSTSSYVSRLMENAVISTPNKETFSNQRLQTQSMTVKPAQTSDKLTEGEGQRVNAEKFEQKSLQPSTDHSIVNSYKDRVKNNVTQKRPEVYENDITNNTEQKGPTPAFWVRQKMVEYSQSQESFEDLEQSLHVRFAEEIDYKSFVENSQSFDNGVQRERNENGQFDDSQEWKEDIEDSTKDDSEDNSSCSQCSGHNSSTEGAGSPSPLGKQSQADRCCLQNEKRIPVEKLNVGDLKTNEMVDTEELTLNDPMNNFPPVLLSKLRELEDEIKVFRAENSNIKALRESLEKERKLLQEEKRRIQLEKKRLQKQMEEEKKTINAHLEEEKQKLAKEKLVFEKYSKSMTKNPSKEERKEIQALREQLTEMKEELNKKESRWGAAQARVRNQVKLLEADNKKLREEVENLRKHAKYWEIFNQKKRGKPFNNTKLIHAISEHISNIAVDNSQDLKNSADVGYFSKNSSEPKTTIITPADLQSMYGVRVIKEGTNENTVSENHSESKSSFNTGNPSNVLIGSSRESEKATVVNHSPEENLDRMEKDFLANPNPPAENINPQNRCKKPCLKETSTNAIKEVVDENGNLEIVFPNGNIKKTNRITGSEKYIYINGDVEEVTQDGTVKYYYSKSRIWHTTLPDGLEIVDFPDGQVEKRHISGITEIIYSNNNRKLNYPDGSQEIIYTDGTRLKIEANKTQVLTLPNGQKEIHTEEWKRREYPDGTMKTLFPDGTTETVYSNGRVRLKDKYGNLVMDSGSPPGS